MKIHQLKKNFPKESIEGITFYNTNLHDALFSFLEICFGKIDSDQLRFRKTNPETRNGTHRTKKHSFDKLFVQIIQSLFWFNPIFYFIKKKSPLFMNIWQTKSCEKRGH